LDELLSDGPWQQQRAHRGEQRRNVAVAYGDLRLGHLKKAQRYVRNASSG
jgi:hypothetical protein